MSIYCPNCGAILTKGTKFCTNCGASMQVISSENDVKKNNEVNLVEESLNQPNKGKRLLIALLVMVVLTIVFFIGKSFFKDVVPTEKPFSVEEQLGKLEGKWYDPTDAVLGDKDVIINFNRKEDVVIAKDEKGLFEAKITPFGANNYQAITKLQGVEGDFELHFYEEEDKLVFFSTLTKSSWYLIKNN
ncbi:zinc-ribbon domain-containing protein [Lutibacter maritimus]|uniref:Zinc-ribbon domain-containing protein n=2 Tax=Lutibacter maritimus TaxID=593133 RepID=A0A1I6R6F2_9FLAO|nr:zinc-ribbon domain-containing protein [Lutibacter maritimus]